MPDRYQPLRDAIAAGAVLVALKRPEGYEDVHPEILIDDAAIHRAFEPEHVGAELAALLAERDSLREALARITKGAPSTEPEWIESDNHGDTADIASARAHYYYASIARAALADGEGQA